MVVTRHEILPRHILSLLLAAHVVLVAYAGWRDAPVYDEVAHLASGLSHWKLRHFLLYQGNPPLPRMIAALPVLLADAEYDWHQVIDEPGTRCEFAVGADFVAANGQRAFLLYTLGRWAYLPFTVLGGLVCYRWAAALFGTHAGLLACALWCSCPNIIANAHWITPDLPAASLGVAASYAYWRWLREPTAGLCVASGTMLGLALLAKATWVILFLLWPALWLVYHRRDRGPGRQVLQLAAALLLGLCVLNLGYACQGSFRRLEDYEFISRSFVGSTQPGVVGNRFKGTWFGTLPVPLPKDFLLGIDVTKEAFESHTFSYLAGELRVGGWWYYYLYGMAVKVPLGTWLVIILAVCSLASHDIRPPAWRDRVSLVGPAVAILVLVSLNPGINRHLRYILIIFPFIFTFAGSAATSTLLAYRPYRLALVAGVAWSIGSSLATYPHSGSYFNELAGGPSNGWRHLASSNVDWGQDLLRLRDWLRQHPEVGPIRLAYYGCFDPRAAGISYRMPPLAGVSGGRRGSGEEYGPRPGWYAVSVHLLTGSPSYIPNGRGDIELVGMNEFAYFREVEPYALVGRTIHVYHITLDEANRVRRRLSLRPIHEGQRAGGGDRDRRGEAGQR